jgi:hypothetical protein
MATAKLSHGQQELNKQIFADVRIEMRSWANEILAPAGRSIDAFRTSCSDGTVFMHLIESLTYRSIGGRRAFLRSARISRK